MTCFCDHAQFGKGETELDIYSLLSQILKRSCSTRQYKATYCTYSTQHTLDKYIAVPVRDSLAKLDMKSRIIYKSNLCPDNQPHFGHGPETFFRKSSYCKLWGMKSSSHES